jgi:hypothetical protein
LNEALQKNFYFLRLPYDYLFGGVSSITKQQMEKVNGFSNLYFGWGIGKKLFLYKNIFDYCFLKVLNNFQGAEGKICFGY